MSNTKAQFSLSLLLGGLVLGQGLRTETPVTVRSIFAPKNSQALLRRNPIIVSSKIMMPWAASILRFINHTKAWWRGEDLVSLRIGLCDENADDESFVSLYERSQLPCRWQSHERLPLEWQCDELIARLVREGKSPNL